MNNKMLIILYIFILHACIHELLCSKIGRAQTQTRSRTGSTPNPKTKQHHNRNRLHTCSNHILFLAIHTSNTSSSTPRTAPTTKHTAQSGRSQWKADDHRFLGAVVRELQSRGANSEAGDFGVHQSCEFCLCQCRPARGFAAD